MLEKRIVIYSSKCSCWTILKNTEEKERRILLVGQILGLLNTDANIKKAYDWLKQGTMEGKHELETDQKRKKYRLRGRSSETAKAHRG
eukprot:TRINITY_DN2546_c0_g1_i1.p2 TRINITY_DN2546_c0_g1~~TRINITY_DN2546_c0_g1_i1.p2  ORF type:complete len:88 (-),score=27.00 TRINITY_DN2546_c0_g1_i1:3-266(-)